MRVFSSFSRNALPERGLGNSEFLPYSVIVKRTEFVSAELAPMRISTEPGSTVFCIRASRIASWSGPTSKLTEVDALEPAQRNHRQYHAAHVVMEVHLY